MNRYFIKFQLILLVSVFFACNSDDTTEDPAPVDRPTPVVDDTVNPTISCIDDIAVNVDLSSNEIVVDYTAPVGTDNNPGAVTVQIEGKKSGETFPVGTTKNTFQVKDKAGNLASCSFNVVVTQVDVSNGGTTPYIIAKDDPTPAGMKWTIVEDLSDEFNAAEFDDNKWFRNPAEDQFRWFGRPPALFDPENVSVADGNLQVVVKKYNTPKNVNGRDWPYGGAILRSKAEARPGYYYEARMLANKTVMSSTFWIAYPNPNCNNPNGEKRKLELDIQECVGRTHAGTANWAKEWDGIYHSNLRQNPDCLIDEAITRPKSIKFEEKNHSRYFVYGCWWKSPTEILFYLDGKFVYSVTPHTNFDINGHITMAMETYNWNPIDTTNDILETGSLEDRTTKYDWVRTWKLEDE